MGIQISSLEFACKGCKTEELHVDPAASIPTAAPRQRRKSCSHVGESLRNIWIRTIHDGKVIPSKVDYMVETVFAESDEDSYVEIVFPDGGRAIHHAVMSENLPLIVYLVNSLNCDINARHRRSEDTPLLLAALNGNLEIVKFLLGFPTAEGVLTQPSPADINLSNANGETIVDVAEMDENCDLLRLLSFDKLESMDTDELSSKLLRAPLLDEMTPVVGLSEDDEDSEEGMPTMKGSDDEDDDEKEESAASSPQMEEPSSGSSQDEVRMTESEKDDTDSAFTAREMRGWLMKRRYKENRKLHLGKGTWSNRYVVLRDGWLCWGPNEVESNVLDQPMERAIFNQAFNVHVLQGVSSTQSTQKTKFKIEIKGSAVRDHRVYEFKASSEEERDEWIANINAWIRETSEGSFVEE